MECTHCHITNRSSARYCKKCGAVLPVNVSLSNGKLSFEPDFDKIVGLNELKTMIQREIIAARNMKKVGFPYNKKNLNMILLGNTGTGKNKLVDVLSRIYFKNGITTKPDVKAISAVEFNEFSKNLATNLLSAKDGILFIDNAHQLVPDGYKPGEITPMDKLYAELEKIAEHPIIILASKAAGFSKYLEENPEVNSRFNLKFYLPDMSVDILYELGIIFLQEKNFNILPDAAEKLKKRFLFLFRNQHNIELASDIGKNGFLVQREINKIINEHFLNPDFQNNPNSILASDIKGEIFETKAADEILKELDDFVGLDGVKDFIRKMVDMFRIQAKDAAVTGQEMSIGSHIVLTGNPGTGKTTLARKLGDVFASAGILSSGHVIDVDRSKLVGQYIGETPLLVQKYCNEAMGGILLVDEAYTLKQGDQDKYGQEAIDTLMKRMEDDRGKFVVIAAGYQKEMQNFIDANPGLKSRVKDNFFHLPDYTPVQLLDILKIFIRKGGYLLHEEAEKKAKKIFTEMYDKRLKGFGNGREVRNFYESILTNRATRITENPDKEYNMEIFASDIPGEETDLSAHKLDLLLEELNKLTGLGSVKTEISQLIDFLEGEKIRAQHGAKKININLHFVFTGNPGTGKTTVARILANIFKGLGILPQGQLIEVTDKDLVEGYVGQTSTKTNKIIDSAMGGVLFIDEAYTLAKKQNSFGQEAIDTLLKRMEDDRGKFIVIAAGYSKEMEDFLESNPGLDSRFSKKINFEDYIPAELRNIMLSRIKNEGLSIEETADAKLTDYLQLIYRNKDASFANARTIRNEFEQILQAQSKRLVRLRKNGESFDPMMLVAEDIPGESADLSADSVEKLLEELNNLTGLASVKSEIASQINFLEAEKLRSAAGGKKLNINLHFVFTGNPGTGKTTVARILARIFKGLGILSKGQLIEVTDKDLVAGYVGQTSANTNKIIDSAMGGVLFIDEAYTLAKKQNSFGQEAIDTLLKRMEDDRGKFIVIAAGYSKEMEEFLNSNPGLDSRFTRKINFEDYTPQELRSIMLSMILKEGLKINEAAEIKITERLKEICNNKNNRFANGRTVRNEFEKILQVQSTRLITLKKKGEVIDPMLIEEDDIL